MWSIHYYRPNRFINGNIVCINKRITGDVQYLFIFQIIKLNLFSSFGLNPPPRFFFKTKERKNNPPKILSRSSRSYIRGPYLLLPSDRSHRGTRRILSTSDLRENLFFGIKNVWNPYYHSHAHWDVWILMAGVIFENFLKSYAGASVIIKFPTYATGPLGYEFD